MRDIIFNGQGLSDVQVSVSTNFTVGDFKEFLVNNGYSSTSNVKVYNIDDCRPAELVSDHTILPNKVMFVRSKNESNATITFNGQGLYDTAVELRDGITVGEFKQFLVDNGYSSTSNVKVYNIDDCRPVELASDNTVLPAKVMFVRSKNESNK